MTYLFEMDLKTWAMLRQLLDVGMALEATAREAWLNNLPAEQQLLAPRLRALLVHQRDSTGSLPLDTLPKIETADFAPFKPGVGASAAVEPDVGPYRLLRLLGEGGMGSVWLAERADGQLQRPVALKLPRLLTDRHVLAERLARERDFLAALNHPNIARLYDAGLSADGRPYLALEYVEGVRIDSYCKNQRLGVGDRLLLFKQVAHAVAHAHAKLIVHRDLKPANILVTAEGQVRLLDFGISKLVEDGSADATELTQQGGRVLTPEYAAPEQIAGQALTIAADIYSLGVVLFELLCGRRPYAARRGSRAALEEAILHIDPPLPSSVVVDGKLRKTLRGDLDTIVLKALNKLPERRYATVNAFVDDIDRYLSNQAVLARPDSRWYRLRKFVTRNKVGVGLSLLVFLAVTAAAVIAIAQARIATRERLRSDQVKAFITSIFEESDPNAPMDRQATTALELLHRARQRVSSELADQPEVRTELLRILGKSYSGLFDLKSAEAVLTQALDETKARARGPREQMIVAEVEIELGEVKKLLGKPSEARVLLDAAIARLGSSGQLQSDAYADAKVLEAGLAINQGDYTAMSLAAGEVISVSTQLHGEANERAAIGYGLLAKKRGTSAADQADALNAASKAYTILRELHGKGQAGKPQVIDAQQGYGVALLGVGDLKGAEAQVAQALSDARALYGPDNIMVGHFAARLGQIHVLQGQLQRGRQEIQDALDLLAKVDPNRSTGSALRLRALAQSLMGLRRSQDALAPLAAAVAILQERKDQRTTLLVQADQAMALIESGRLQQARELLLALDAAGSAMQPPQRPLRAMARSELLRGDALSAKSLLLQALAESERDPRKPYLADISIELAQALFDLGDYPGAEAGAQAALKELERTTVMATPNHAAAWTVLARARLERGAATDALASLQRADAIWRDMGLEDRSVAQTAAGLAQAYRALGHEGEARVAAARATKMLSASPHIVDARLLAQLRTR